MVLHRFSLMLDSLCHWQSSIPQIIHGRPTSEQPFIDEGIQPFLLIRRNILVPSFTDTVTPIITCSQHHAAMQVCKWRCTHMFSCSGTYPMWHPRVAPTLQILRSDYYSCFHIGEPYFTFSPYSLYLLFSLCWANNRVLFLRYNSGGIPS